MPPLNDNLEPDLTVEAKRVYSKESVNANLLQELHKIFVGENADKHFHEYLTKKKLRPSNWKNIATVPYYRERFALELKVVIDAMIKDGQDREYRYEDFKAFKKNTVYLRVNQAKLYLLEELDFDGRFARAFQCISISRKSTGVRLSFHRDVREGTSFMPASIVSNESSDDLRSRIDSFLQNASTGQKFEEKRLSLSYQEVETLRNSFIGLEGFVANITESGVKIIKIV